MIINASLKKKKKKKNNRLVRKKNLKNQLKMIRVHLINRLMKKKKASTTNYLKRILSFKDHQRPNDMLKSVYKTNDKKKNSKLVNIIKSGLSDLKNEIEDMSEEEKEIEKPSEILNLVEEILEFNKQNQQGQRKGLKILTLDQMLSRLLITLAQLKAGNNTQKPKYKIRQLFYSLYRSKKLIKNIYKCLVDII